MTYNEFKYEQSTLSKFDIIGSYFVNLFYNEFYSKANTLKINGSFDNLTDAYKNILGSYLDFIKKPECFKQIVNGIHAYCISTTKYTTMSHKECIDFMVNEFIPQKLWNSIRETQKNKLFHESINSSITIFITDIISNHLHMIIDNHSHKENITILQDLFLKIILLEKDKIYSKFLNPGNNNTISTELFKTKLMELISEKKDLTVLNDKLLKNVNILNQLADKNNNIIIELQTKNKSYINTINELKKNIDKLNETIVLLNRKINHTPQTGPSNALNNLKPDVKEISKETSKRTIINNNDKQTEDNETTHHAEINFSQSTSKNKIPNSKKDVYSILLNDGESDINESSGDSDNSDKLVNTKQTSKYKTKLRSNMSSKEKELQIIQKATTNKSRRDNERVNELEFDNDDNYY